MATLRRKKWKKEFSAGGVVYRKNKSNLEVLLIMPNKWNSEEGTGIWRLPKGWIGEGEAPEEAALREVKEETGVKANLIDLLGTEKFFYKWEGKNIFKTVVFYLMDYISGDLEDHDSEVHEARWFEIKEATKILKFKAERDIVIKAKAKLAKFKKNKS